MSARIRGASAELEDLGQEQDEYTKSTSKLRDTVLGLTGFDIQKDENSFKDLYEIIDGIGQKWNDLSDIDQSALAEALAGKRNARGLYSIFSNMEDLHNAYQTAVNSEGSAMQEQEKYQDSVQFKINQAKASLQELASNFMSSDFLKGVISSANNLLQIVNSIVQKIGSVPAMLATIGGAAIFRSALTGEGLFADIIKNITATKLGDAATSTSTIRNIKSLAQNSGEAAQTAQSTGANVQNTASEQAQAAAKAQTASASSAKAAAEQAEAAATRQSTMANQQNANGDISDDWLSRNNLDDEIDTAVDVADDIGDNVTRKGVDIADDVGDAVRREAIDTATDVGVDAVQATADGVEDAMRVAKIQEAYGDTFGNLAKNKAIQKGAEQAGENAVKATAKTVENSASKYSSGIVSAIGDALTSPIGLVTAGMTAITITTAAIEADHQKKLQKMQEANERFEKSQSLLTDFSTVQSARSAIDSGNLSDDQVLSRKQQIYSIQEQITQQYGDQAAGIDLVNGNLDTQLQKLQAINKQQAEKNLRDTDTAKAYKTAEKAMTRTDQEFSVGEISHGQNGELTDLDSKIKKIAEDAGMILDNSTDGSGQYEIKIKDKNIEQADESLKSYIADLNTLQMSGSLSDNETTYVDRLIKTAEKQQKGIQETISDYKDNYKEYLQQQIYAGGNGDVGYKYSDSITKLNTALAGGDSAEIQQALANYHEAKNTVDSLVKENPNYDLVFGDEGIGGQLDSVGLKMYELKDIAEDSVASTGNEFADQTDEITAQLNKLKKAGLNTADIKDVLTMPDVNTGETADNIRDLAQAFGVLDDEGNVDSMALDQFASTLQQLGIVASTTAEQVTDASDTAAESWNSFLAKTTSALSNIDTVNAALTESFSGKGLSVKLNSETGQLEGNVMDLISTFSQLDDFSFDKLFMQTANGLMINTENLRKFQSELNDQTLAGFDSQMADLTKQLKEAQQAGQDTSGIQNQINQLKILQAQFEGANSAYQRWIDASKTGEASDQYANIRDTALKNGDELLEQGLVGTNQFRALAQLVSGQDLSSSTTDEIVAAYKQVDQQIEGTSYTLRDFFADGVDGTNNFINAMSQLGDEYVEVGEDGDVTFKNINPDELAQRFHTSTDVIESMFKMLQDRGAQFHFFTDEQMAELDKVDEKVQRTQQKLTAPKYSDQSWYTPEFEQGVSFNIDDLDSVDKIESKIGELNTLKFTPGVDPSAVELLNSLIDQLLQKEGILNGTEISPTVSLDGWNQAQDVASQLEERINQINNTPASVGLTVEGDTQVQSLIQQLAEMPTQYQIALGITTQGQGQATVEQIEQWIKDNTGKNGQFTLPITADTSQVTQQVDNAVENTDAKAKIGADTSQAENQIESNLGNKQITVKVLTTQQAGSGTEEELRFRTGSNNYGATKTANAGGGSSSIQVDNSAALQAIQQVQSALKNVKNKKVSLNVKHSGATPSFINNIASAIDSLHSKQVNVTVSNKGASARNIQAIVNAINSLQSKTVTTTVIRNEVKGSDVAARGTAHILGTAQIPLPKPLGYANASGSGNWGVKKDETSLLNEVGGEIVVHPDQGTWEIMNNGYPTFAKLKKNDIVFNAKQSEEILKNGKLKSGYGTFANGQAYAGGTANADPVNRTNVNISGTKSTFNMYENYAKTATQTQKAADNVSKSAKSSENAVKQAAQSTEDANTQELDWIETLMSRIDREITNIDKIASNAAYSYNRRNKSLTEQMTVIQKQILTDQQAAQKYLQKANAVQLDESYKKKVREGAPQIEEIQQAASNGDSNQKTLSDLINDYKTNYEKYLQYTDAVEDANQNMGAKSKEIFDNIVKQYDDFITKLENSTDRLDIYEKWFEAFDVKLDQNFYQKRISELQRQRQTVQNKYNDSKLTASTIVNTDGINGTSSYKSAGTKSIANSIAKNNVYRLYNPSSGETFYTQKKSEYDKLVKAGWQGQGAAFTAPDKSNTPVYRLYNKKTGKHHFTTSKNEVAGLQKKGWKKEGTAFYADDDQTAPVYRLFNKKTGQHLETVDAQEQKKLLADGGWVSEGVGWYSKLTKQVALYNSAQGDASETGNEVTQTLEEMRTKMLDLDEQISETQWEALKAQFEDMVDVLNENIEALEAEQDLLSNLGRVTSRSLLNQQIQLQQQILEELQAYDTELEHQMSLVSKGSIEWHGYYAQLRKNRTEEIKAQSTIASLQKQIKQSYYDEFDQGIEQMTRFANEAEFFRGLWDDDELWDKQGHATEKGVASFGMIITQLNAYEEQAERLGKAYDEAMAEFNADPLNKDLLDRADDLLDRQHQAIQNEYQQKQAIKSLVSDGIQREISALDDLIDKYLQLLDDQKSAYDYARSIDEKQDAVNKYRKQLMAWSGDDSEEGAARRQTARKNLKDAQQDLKDTQEDRRISEIKQTLESLKDDFSQTLNARLDNLDELVKQVTNEVNLQGKTVQQVTQDTADYYGARVSTGFDQLLSAADLQFGIWQNGAWTEYDSTVDGICDYLRDKISALYDYVAQIPAMLDDLKTQICHLQTYIDAAAKDSPYYNAEDWAVETGVTNGTSATTLDLKGGLSRGRAAQLMYNASGDTYSGGTGFSDVSGNKYYSTGVGWANSKGYLNGKSDGQYHASDTMTRAQAVTALWRQAGSPSVSMDGVPFTDVKNGSYYAQAVAWAYKNGITYGKSTTKFDPNGTITGEQFTTMLYRMNGSPSVHGYASGIKKVGYDQNAWTNEKGQEFIIRKSDGAQLKRLSKADMVLNHGQSQNVWEFSKNPKQFMEQFSTPSVSTYNQSMGNLNINNTFNLPNVTDYQSFIATMRKDTTFEKMIQEMTIGRMNGNGKLKKFTV